MLVGSITARSQCVRRRVAAVRVDRWCASCTTSYGRRATAHQSCCCRPSRWSATWPSSTRWWPGACTASSCCARSSSACGPWRSSTALRSFSSIAWRSSTAPAGLSEHPHWPLHELLFPRGACIQLLSVASWIKKKNKKKTDLHYTLVCTVECDFVSLF